MERTNRIEDDIRKSLERLAEDFRDLRAYMYGAGFDRDTAEKLLHDVYSESLKEYAECRNDGDMFAKNATRGFTKAALMP